MNTVRKLTYEQLQSLEEIALLSQFECEEIPAEALLDTMFKTEQYKKE